MFQNRITTVGVQTAPKSELAATSGAYTEERLYLVPIRVKAHTKFSQYDWNFAVTVGLATRMSYQCAIYERVGKLSSGTPAAVLVPNTSVTVNNIIAGFTTTALGKTVNLVPGDYFIGFIFDKVGLNGLTVTSTASHTNNTWITGDWMYHDPGSFTLPTSIAGATLGYIHAVSQNPFWAALTYIGDVLP